MNRPQPRQPPGIPGAGQYAADPAHPEAEIEFTVDDEVDELLEDGSWEYPPAHFSDPEVMIRFWQRVPVSETVLERFALNYSGQQRLWLQVKVGVWERANPRPDEKAMFGAKQSRENIAAWTAARQDEVRRLNVIKPPTIPDPYIRTSARVAQMYRYVSYVGLGDAETTRIVLDSAVHIGQFPQGTVEAFSKRWLLDKLPAKAFKDPTRHMPDQLEKVVEGLGSLNSGMEKLKDEVYRMSALQNMSPTDYAAEAAKRGW